MTERTLFIVKPDAIAKRALGKILAMIEASGLTFFGDLIAFMTSGPIFVGVLEGDGAVRRWRDLMGPTDSTKAPAGTVRGEFGTDVEKNAAHGSDGPETARAEIAFFFPGLELPGVTAQP
jgi:nucleoside-diphosphate kinase